MSSSSTLKCSASLAVGTGLLAGSLYFTTATITYAGTLLAFGPVGWFFAAISLAVVLFVAPEIGIDMMKGSGMCLYEQYLLSSKNSGGCVSGSRPSMGEDCEACPKIYRSRENSEATKKYKEHYEGDQGYTPETPSLDPINTGSFTNYICSFNAEGKDGVGIITPYDKKVFAARQYPYGGCEWGVDDTDANIERDKKYGFLTNDPSECNRDKWIDFNINPSDGSAAVKKRGTLNYKPMEHQGITDTEGSEETCGGRKCDWWTKMGAIKYWNLAEDWIERLTESDARPNVGLLPNLIINAQKFDSANVCQDKFVLAGAHLDQIPQSGLNGEVAEKINDTMNEVKHHDEEIISNHCCPKIIGSEDCPHSGYNKPIDLYTSKEDFDPVRPENEETVKSCYMYDYTKYDEFFPKKIPNNERGSGENEYISNFRFGGVQCGPRHLGNGNNQIESIKPFRNKGDDTEYLDVKRPEETSDNRQGDSNGTDPPAGSYYGTRFKLDNRYKYTPEKDSGATGYEHYLDPEDYVLLNEEQKGGNIISQLFNTTFVNEIGKDTKLTGINDKTTINDIIPRQLGHENRKKYLCDNFVCNDIEKTKYIQTIYDGFCTNWRDPSPGKWIKDGYKKFYRPIGIEKDGVGGEQKSSPEKSMFSDICCDPIPFSLQSSFVGCDAKGKNPYFIDAIMTDASPIYPQTRNRKIIKPRSRPNLNQCIPSMEDKCYIDSEKRDILKSEQEKLTFKSYNDLMNSCNNKLDANIITKDKDKDIANLTYNSLDTDLNTECHTGLVNSKSICRGVQYRKNIDEGESIYQGDYYDTQYWLYDKETKKGRGAYGYAPHKGTINDFTTKPDPPFDFELIQPALKSVYTECNELPHEKKIRDIEIYDKRIDWVPEINRSDSHIRYIGENPPKASELQLPEGNKYFKLICDENYEQDISEPEKKDDYYYKYTVSCKKPPTTDNRTVVYG